MLLLVLPMDVQQTSAPWMGGTASKLPVNCFKTICSAPATGERLLDKMVMSLHFDAHKIKYHFIHVTISKMYFIFFNFFLFFSRYNCFVCENN